MGEILDDIERWRAGGVADGALIAPLAGAVGVAAKAAVGHGFDVRQEGGQGAGGGGFSGTALAPDEDATNLGANCVKN